MNKGPLSIPILLIFACGFAAGVAAPRDGMSMPPATLTGPCNQRYPDSNMRVASLLQYYGWLPSASAADQAAQYQCADSAAANAKLRGKLILALTLILPEASFADFERAKELLDDYLKNADNEQAEDRSLALLLLALLEKVARLQEQLDQLQEIEEDITETEQSVNVPTPAPAPEPEPEPEPEPDDEPKEDDTSSR